jgi:hypothetical protein
VAVDAAADDITKWASDRCEFITLLARADEMIE